MCDICLGGICISFISKALRYGSVLPATDTGTIPAFTSQLQGVIALWLTLIASTHVGVARLS